MSDTQAGLALSENHNIITHFPVFRLSRKKIFSPFSAVKLDPILDSIYPK